MRMGDDGIAADTGDLGSRSVRSPQRRWKLPQQRPNNCLNAPVVTRKGTEAASTILRKVANDVIAADTGDTSQVREQ